MKILCRSRQIRQRNELQQRLRLRRNHRRIDHVGLAVELELLPGCRIENRRGQRGEIAAALRHRRDGRQQVGGRTPSRSAPASVEKCFSAAIVNFRDIQWTADVRAEMQLVVVGFGQGLSIDRERPRIESGSIVIKIYISVRLIHVEAAPEPPECNRSASTLAASAEFAASSPKTSKSHLLGTLAEFLNAVLKFTF